MRFSRPGFRAFLAALLFVLPATAVVAIGTPAAQAAGVHPMVYLLGSTVSEPGSCLTMAGNGQPAMTGCAYPATTAPQRFNLRTDPSTGGTWIASNGSSRCVTASGSSGLVRTACNSDPADLWDMSWSGEISLRLVNRATGRCLAPGWGWLAPPIQVSCSGTGEWFAIPILARYEFQPTHTFKCLDIWNNDGGMQVTDRAQQWECLGANQANQLWDLELVAIPRWGTSVRPPMYRLHPMQDEDMCLAHDQRYNDGYQVHQGLCSGGTAWYLYPLDLTPGSERFQIKAETAHAIDHEVCLDVHSGGGSANGVKVQLWRCLGPDQANQVWHPVMLNP